MGIFCQVLCYLMIRFSRSQIELTYESDCQLTSCMFGDRYIRVLGDDATEAISWDEANEYCKTEYQTTLATVQRLSTETDATDSSAAIEAAKEACTGDDSSTQKCWIGLQYNNGEDSGTYDETLWAWASGEALVSPTEFDFASGEPTTASYTWFGQYCVYLEKSATDEWDDWNCDGAATSSNNLIISAFLCDNPDYQPDKECLCNCGCCIAEGDPHITTYVFFCFVFLFVLVCVC